MINVGRNAAEESTRQFKAMGTNIVVVQNAPSTDGISHTISLSDSLALPIALKTVAATAPIINSSANISFQGKNIYAGIVGATTSLKDVVKLPVLRGRFISDFDRFKAFAVIGPNLADALSTSERRVQLGDAVRIEDYLFTIIGVTDEAMQNPLLPVEFNNAIIIPLESMRRLSSNSDISSVIVRLVENADTVTASAEIRDYFQSKATGSSIQVQSARQLIEGMQHQNQLFTYLLTGIGSISLLVSGIGVMNVLLISVLVRKREIGLRMAIGARERDIFMMFLIEASALTLVGGAIGTILGLILAYLIAYISDWHFVLTLSSLPLGIGMSVVIGLFSGIYPGVAAARLHPVIALRSE